MRTLVAVRMEVQRQVARLVRRSFPILPESGVLRLAGPGARPVGPDMTAFADGSLLVSGYDHVDLSTLQGRIDVRVIVEEWAGTPPGSSNLTWEEETAAVVFLRGFVTVSGAASGPVVSLRLRGGAPLYHADVYARRRLAVARRYDQLLWRYGNPRNPRLHAEQQHLSCQEEFLIRLRPAAPEEGHDAWVRPAKKWLGRERTDAQKR